MKKIVMMLMVFSTLAVSAQKKISDKKDFRKEMRSDYTPEQRADLRAKQMTLSLDLNDKQQKQVRDLLQSKTIKKTDTPNWKSMTSEQRFEARNASLDRQIEIKRDMKNILTPEQYKKWEMTKNRTKSHGKRKHSQRSIKE